MSAGSPVPNTDLPGWTLVLAEDFDTDVSVGSWPGTSGAYYYDNFQVYHAGAATLSGYQAKGTYPDTWTDTSGNGTYYPSKVFSTHDSYLDYYIHTETLIGTPTHLIGAPIPRVFQTYGRYSVRYMAEKSAGVDFDAGYKTAWLLWPLKPTGYADTEAALRNERGEIDWPEGNLDDVQKAFFHEATGNPATNVVTPSGGYVTAAVYPDWHIATIEWSPGRLSFILDGVTIGTNTVNVPTFPMAWVMQTESRLSGGAPPDATEGHVYVDWIAVWERAAGVDIAYEGVGTVVNDTAGTSVVVPVPVGAVGDLLVCQVSTDGGAGITSLTDWTDVPGVGHTATVLNPKARVQYKFADGTEGADETWTIGSAKNTGIMRRFSGVDATTPFDVSGTKWDATDATQTAIVVPTLTTVTDNCLLISGGACNSNTVTFAQPSTQGGAWTETTELAGAVGKSSFAAYQPVLFAAGATGTMTSTLSSARASFAWMAALRPAVEDILVGGKLVGGGLLARGGLVG